MYNVKGGAPSTRGQAGRINNNNVKGISKVQLDKI